MDSLRSVVLCADDYGLTDGVSRGILELVEAGRLSATGAMTNMPGWRRAASALAPFKGRIAIGLHLNLTTGSPLGPMPRLAPGGAFPTLKDILPKALTGRLPVDEIRQEISRQIDAFEDIHGDLPSFVDGHQHVHVLPAVRQALMRTLKARGYSGRVWLRDPTDRTASILRRRIGRSKALIVGSLATGFGASAGAAGFEINEGFSGFSPLDLSVPAGRIFENALTGLGSRPLVMCHPGHADAELRGLDPAVDSRPAELAYLRSDAFRDLLARQRIALVPNWPKLQ
jgi:chitin disaccharide deacetylase